jgi:hypothetical protein
MRIETGDKARLGRWLIDSLTPTLLALPDLEAMIALHVLVL